MGENGRCSRHFRAGDSLAARNETNIADSASVNWSGSDRLACENSLPRDKEKEQGRKLRCRVDVFSPPTRLVRRNSVTHTPRTQTLSNLQQLEDAFSAYL